MSVAGNDGLRFRLGWKRIAAILIGGVLLMWLSLAVTLAMTIGTRRPRQVLALWPSAALAHRALAWDLVAQSPGPAEQREAIRYAGAALSREPVLAAAASTMGSAAGLRGDNPRAQAAFTYANQLSRRDLQTQLWFIEHAVQQGDISEALHHYDIALRTTGSADALLLPVLAQASNDAAVRGPLIALLRRGPVWRTRYLRAMLQAPTQPVALAEQIAWTGLDATKPDDAAIIEIGLAGLVQAGQYRLATTLLPPSTPTGIRNGSFERVPTLVPFDWWLSGESDLMAYRDPSQLGEGAYTLRIATIDRGGPVARQLVTLPAGRFVLAGTVGNTGDGTSLSPSITIACAGAHDPMATEPLTTNSGDTRHFTLGFVVPNQDCPAQWITIATPPAATVSAWIDNLVLRRV